MPDRGCDVVVVGASAGGVEALKELVGGLPGDFASPILVVLHVPASGPSVLPEILSRSGSLPALHAVDGQELEAGHIYVAPPDHHMQLDGDRIALTRGPRENGHRPSIDVLFRSTARSYDNRAAGVVLSGTLDDGTVGLYCIKQSGGATLVQDPDEAAYPSMPTNAINYMQPDYIQPVGDLVNTLVRLTSTTNGRNGTRHSLDDPAPSPHVEEAQPGELAPFSCPDCGGTLWETTHGDVASYRCRVGHAFTMNSLVSRHAEVVERALWTAYRALEERSAMSRRVARRLAERGRGESAERFTRQADGSARQAAELKAVLDQLEAAPDAGAAPEPVPVTQG
jgi:two-component system, chemotaxis family, protein-glutamate methylesterase/glutaminase